MTKMKNESLIYEKAIRNIMLRIGLFFDDVSIDDDIQYVFTNSLTFITFIIELEQEFNIEIPDDYLIPERLGSLRQLDNILVELLPQSGAPRDWRYKIKMFVRKFRSSFIRKGKPI